MGLLLQHALVVALDGLVVAIVGVLVNNRLGHLRIMVNGRMTRMQEEIDRLNNTDKPGSPKK